MKIIGYIALYLIAIKAFLNICGAAKIDDSDALKQTKDKN